MIKILKLKIKHFNYYFLITISKIQHSLWVFLNIVKNISLKNKKFNLIKKP